MKGFLINIVLFFSIVTVIDIAIGCAGDYMQGHAKGGEVRTFNDFVRNDFHDIVILGSSRALHHYDTPFLSDTLSMDVYNAGYDGNGAVLGFGLFSMVLERYQPKLLLYDVEPLFDIVVYDGDNQHRRYINKLKPYYRDIAVSSIIKDVSEEEWYKVHSGMVRYNTGFISLLIDNAVTRPMPSGGFVPLYGAIDSVSYTVSKDYQVDDFKLGYFERIIELANDHHVPMIVVASPMLGADSSSSLQPAFDICEKWNVPVLDYYVDSLFVQHKEWFHDAGHLNVAGSREYSRIIAREILDYLDENE